MGKRGAKTFLIAVGTGSLGALVLVLAIRETRVVPSEQTSPARRSVSAFGDVSQARGQTTGPAALPRKRPRQVDPMAVYRSQERRLTDTEKIILERYPRFKMAWLAKLREHQVAHYKAQRSNLQPPPRPDVEASLEEWKVTENQEYADPRQLNPQFFDR